MAIRRTASRFRFGGRRRDRGTARSPAHEHTRQQKKKKKLKGTKPKSKLTYASRAPPRASLAAIPALAPPRLPRRRRRRRRRIRRLGFRPLANDAKLSSGEGKRKEKKKKVERLLCLWATRVLLRVLPHLIGCGSVTLAGRGLSRCFARFLV